MAMSPSKPAALLVAAALALLACPKVYAESQAASAGRSCPIDAEIDVSPLSSAKHEASKSEAEAGPMAQMLAAKGMLARSLEAPVWMLIWQGPYRAHKTLLFQAKEYPSGRWEVERIEAAWRRNWSYAEPTRHPPTDMDVQRRWLSVEEGRHLTGLLSAPCLYKEPPYIPSSWTGSGTICIDGPQMVMGIDFQGQKRTAVEECAPYGLTRQIEQLLAQAIDDDTGD
jgi:hypothetical protein